MCIKTGHVFFTFPLLNVGVTSSSISSLLSVVKNETEKNEYLKLIEGKGKRKKKGKGKRNETRTIRFLRMRTSSIE